MENSHSRVDVENPLRGDYVPTFNESFNWHEFGLQSMETQPAQSSNTNQDSWATAKDVDRILGKGVKVARDAGRSAARKVVASPGRGRVAVPLLAVPGFCYSSFLGKVSLGDFEAAAAMSGRAHSPRLDVAGAAAAGGAALVTLLEHIV